MSKKKKKGYKGKVLFLFFLSIGLLCAVLYTSTYWYDVFEYKHQANELKKELDNQLSLEQEYQSQITKLQDPEYIAKYAREKYLYSKKGEIIIRIED